MASEAGKREVLAEERPRGAFTCSPQFSLGVEACSPPARVGTQPLVSGAAELTVSAQCRVCLSEAIWGTLKEPHRVPASVHW